MVILSQHHSEKQKTSSSCHSSIAGERDIDTIVNVEMASDVEDHPSSSKPGERNIRFAENHKKGRSIYIKQQSNQNHDVSGADTVGKTSRMQQQEQQDEKAAKSKRITLSAIGQSISSWFDRVLRDQSNRHGLQVAVGFTIGSLFVIVQPINNTFANTVWVSFTVVMVLDNTVGGLLNLSLRRILGTVVGGILAMIGMVITRAIFPTWSIAADIVLSCYLFIQVFFIAKCKKWPNISNACSIGLLTTAVIALSGYTNLTKEEISHSVVLAAWRILSVILGIIIAMLAAFIFPIQASRTMRTNLGDALEETADLFESTAEYYLEINATKAPPLFKAKRSATMSSSSSQPIYVKSPSIYIQRTSTDQCSSSSLALPEPAATSIHKPKSASVASVLSRTPSPSQSPFPSPSPSRPGSPPPEDERITLNDPNEKPLATGKPPNQQQQRPSLGEFSDPINGACDKALKVLNKLQTESTRMQNVSSEYYLQLPFHLFRGHRERCRRDMRRAARYTEAIEAMKQIVWPLVSYRLLLPLIQLSVSPIRTNIQQQQAVPELGLLSSSSSTDLIINRTVHQRIIPTQATLESFEDSLLVMRRLGAMLKDRRKKLRQHPDWYQLQQMISKGQSHIQQELAQLVQLSVNDPSLDGLKLISYYGFLVRCSTIWEGLNAVVDKLGPEWHSRRSSVATLNPLEPTVVLDLSRHT